MGEKCPQHNQKSLMLVVNLRMCMNIQIFWFMTMCHNMNSSQPFGIMWSKKTAPRTFEISSICPVTQHHILDNLNLQQHSCFHKPGDKFKYPSWEDKG
jgi:hypothetical protein